MGLDAFVLSALAIWALFRIGAALRDVAEANERIARRLNDLGRDLADD